MERATEKTLVNTLAEVTKMLKGMDSMRGDANDKVLITYGGTIFAVSVEAVGNSSIDSLRDFSHMVAEEQHVEDSIIESPKSFKRIMAGERVEVLC